jgi:hypothetical protein
MARLYSDTEIAALLARAAERQQAAPADGPTSGLTLDEIERLAAEAGLDPAHVRAAASELDTRVPVPMASAGRRTHERWIDVPFSDVAWEEAVTALRARHPGTNWAQYTAMGTLAPGGDLSRVGAAHEWRHTAWTGATTTLTASPRGERTRLRLVSADEVQWGDRATAAIYAFSMGVLPALAAAVAAKATTGSGWAALLTFVTTLVAAVALGATLGASSVRRRRQARAAYDAQTLDVVAAAFEEAAPYAPTAVGAGAPSGRVDFDAAVGDRADEDAADEVRSRRRESS